MSEEDNNNTSNEKETPEAEPALKSGLDAMPFRDVLLQAVKRLKEQLLLFGVCAAIILLGAGVVFKENRQVVIPLLFILFLFIAGAWVLLEAQKRHRSESEPGTVIKSGDIRSGCLSISFGSQQKTGDVTGPTSKDRPSRKPRKKA